MNGVFIPDFADRILVNFTVLCLEGGIIGQGSFCVLGNVRPCINSTGVCNGSAVIAVCRIHGDRAGVGGNRIIGEVRASGEADVARCTADGNITFCAIVKGSSSGHGNTVARGDIIFVEDIAVRSVLRRHNYGARTGFYSGVVPNTIAAGGHFYADSSADSSFIPQHASSFLIKGTSCCRDGTCILQDGTGSFRYVLACFDNVRVRDRTIISIFGGHAYRTGLTFCFYSAAVFDARLRCSHGHRTGISRDSSIFDFCACLYGNA